MTDRTFVSQSSGPIVLGIDLPVGSVRVQVLDNITAARVVLRTDDASGPAADAISRARSNQDGQALAVEVPEIPSNVITQTIRGNRITQTIGTLHGSVTGATFVNGKWVAGGVTGVMDVVSPIEAIVTLPVGSSLAVVSQSADAIVRGNVDRMEFRSVSGDLRIDGAGSLNATTTSGDLSVGHLTGRLHAGSVSGDIAVGFYSGTHADLSTTSGDVLVRAADATSGSLRAETVSGDVRVIGGSSGLRISARSVSGDVRRS
ncbi:DUF4097 family beta strand repeat-containing protein [Streptomyces sp. NPDC053048]|uniref:DUF4097 family beta strand repeat-containing protein n=1 Tax=Streptomyces sp. NPDC053048 TaxID=3365694 RepID=UPI0037D6E231